MGDIRHRLGHQRGQFRNRRAPLHRPLPRHRPDPQPVRLRHDPEQVGDPVQIDQNPRLRQPKIQNHVSAIANVITT